MLYSLSQSIVFQGNNQRDLNSGYQSVVDKNPVDENKVGWSVLDENSGLKSSGQMSGGQMSGG